MIQTNCKLCILNYFFFYCVQYKGISCAGRIAEQGYNIFRFYCLLLSIELIKQSQSKSFILTNSLLDMVAIQKEAKNMCLALAIEGNFRLVQSKSILYCDAEIIMRRYNNVEVSQCVLFDREKTIGNCFSSR